MRVQKEEAGLWAVTTQEEEKEEEMKCKDGSDGVSGLEESIYKSSGGENNSAEKEKQNLTRRITASKS